MQDLRVKGNSEEGGLRRASEGFGGGWVVGEERSFRIEQMERCFSRAKEEERTKIDLLVVLLFPVCGTKPFVLVEEGEGEGQIMD